MTTLTTTAWVLHDLGLAAGFGGNLFGQLALNPAVRVLSSKDERGRVTHVAWDRYKLVNAVSLAAMAGTWLIGRSIASGREVGRASRGLVVAKDFLVGAAVLTGVGSMFAGTMLNREEAGAPRIESGSEPAVDTTERVARLQRTTNFLGRTSLLLNAAVLATTTILAMTAGRSSKWSFFSRLLP